MFKHPLSNRVDVSSSISLIFKVLWIDTASRVIRPSSSPRGDVSVGNQLSLVPDRNLTRRAPTRSASSPGLSLSRVRPNLVSASFASTMPTTPSVRSGNSVRANNTSTGSTALSQRYQPLQVMTVGSAPEAHQDLRNTLRRRRVSEPPILDDPFAGVSPIPAAPMDAKTRIIRDSQSPFIVPPMPDRAGRAPMVSIPSSLLESLVANTLSMNAMVSNREHIVHERSFDSFNTQNPNTSSFRRNLRRKKARILSKFRESPTKPSSANTSVRPAKPHASDAQDPTPPRLSPAPPPAESPSEDHIKTILGVDISTSLDGSSAIGENPPFEGPDDHDDFLSQSPPDSAAKSSKRWESQPPPRLLTNISAARMNIRSPLTHEEYARLRTLAHRPITSSGITSAQLLDVILTEKGLPLSRCIFVPVAAPPVASPPRLPDRRSRNPQYRTPPVRDLPLARPRAQHARPAKARSPTPPPASRTTRQRTKSSSPFEDPHLSVSPPPNRAPLTVTPSPPRRIRRVRLEWNHVTQTNPAP